MTFRLTILLIATSLGLCKAEEIKFNRNIRPILSDNCFSCHGPNSKDAKGGLQLHSKSAATVPLGKNGTRRAIVPGNKKASEVWKRINAPDPEDRMPPTKSNHILTDNQIKVIGQWIEQGAEYENHWSFQRPDPPQGTIDKFIRNELKRKGLRPSKVADKTTLIRRLTQDLTGLPPTLEQIKKFTSDNDPASYEKEVNRLLSSHSAAERLTVNWLDGARYADTNGYSIDDHRDMWIWRDWVIHAFLENMPFDQFTVEQIAGDLIPEATEQQKVATGFLRNSMNTHEGGTIAEEYRVTYTADKVDTVSTVFMGLTMKCAQCHDHKYDPITQEEYYKFFAFFNTSSEPGNGAVNSNTAPIIEANSLICSPERVKRDAGFRLTELGNLRIRPEPKMAKIRDEWEKKTLKNLTPPEFDKGTKDLPTFPEHTAHWIWNTPDQMSENVEFKKEFELKELPEKAQIWFTCDNECNVKVNGKLIGSNADWTKPKKIQITNLIKGSNVITVNGKNEKNSPAGLILSMVARLPQKNIYHLATNSKWDTREITNDKKQSWKKAIEIAKYGDNPWGQLNTIKEKGRNEPLFLAIKTERKERSKDQWKTINDAFAAKSGPFKIYQNQLNLEEKAIRKAADTGRSTVMVMNYKPRKTHILIRGAYDQHGKEVQSGGPSALPPLNDHNDKAKTRLDLAKWIINPSHPLTARVIVNRYWQMIFGTGLVKTSEDFGAQGEYPSHPELLDRLASDFITSGWNLRKLIKRIVMSETYRQESIITPKMMEKDPYNRLLARAPRFRLDAEFVRDSALAAGGLLNKEIGGPSVYPYQPDGLWSEVSHYGYPSGFTSQKYLPGTGRANYRRSMYTIWKRTSPPPTMVIFDAPNRETCNVRRLQTNTPLQALVLQNDPQYLEASRALGEIMASTKTIENGIETGFLRVIGRKPNPLELQILTSSFDQYRDSYSNRQNDAKSLIHVGGSKPRVKDKIEELAAWTLIASTLLNMDEFVTRQ
ncbi:MAG: PSD1 and planctomycete cytochrome C domain-containing protein [Verrucomicrobiota bacterium]|nr:PSD1 and planctomycete cytochrome C domain-containing protein [Verrucomicrobiota bacterium]